MGTKPMVFPMDASGDLYAIHDEHDNQVCAGSREACYRLLEVIAKPIGRPTDNRKSTTICLAESFERRF